MSASHRIIPICLLMAATACLAGSVWAAGQFPPDDAEARQFVERVFRARFESEAGVAEVNRECTYALRSLRDNPNVSACPDVYDALEIAADCTSPGERSGRQSVLFDFSGSRDPGIARLRDEIGIPPPPGGVLVTVYSTPGALPEALRRRLVGGFYWPGDLMPPLSRIIVLYTSRLRASEARVAISHRLAYAYIEECFGEQRYNAPVSGLPDYVLPESRLAQWRDWYGRRDLPAESPVILRYLEAVRGAPALHRFLRSAATGPVEDALRNELGILDADRLTADARKWETRANGRLAVFTVMILLVLMVAALFALLRTHRDARRKILKYGLLPAGALCLLAMAISHATRHERRWIPEAASPPSPELSLCSELAVRHWIRAVRPGISERQERDQVRLVQEAIGKEMARRRDSVGIDTRPRIASAVWAGDPKRPDLFILAAPSESLLPGYSFRVAPQPGGYGVELFDTCGLEPLPGSPGTLAYYPGHHGWKELRAVDVDDDGRTELVMVYTSGTHGSLDVTLKKQMPDGGWREVWEEGTIREGQWTIVPGKAGKPSIVVYSSDAGMREHDPPRPCYYSEYVWDDARSTMRWVRGADSDRSWDHDKWTRQAGIFLAAMGRGSK